MIFSSILCAINIAFILFAAVSDVRTGRVKNTLLIGFLFIGATFHICSYLFGEMLWNSYKLWLLNLAISFAAAILLYRTDIWAPGDAKLFLVVAMGFPEKFYAAGEGNVFPSIGFIVYSFAAGYIWLVISSWWKKKPIRFQSEKISALSILKGIGFSVGLQSLIQYVSYDFFADNIVLLVLCIIGFGLYLQRKSFRIYSWIGTIGFAVYLIDIILEGQWTHSVVSVVMGIIIAVIISFLNMHIHNSLYKEIYENEVHPGIILSYASILSMQNCIDPDLPHSTTENRRSRINEKQAEAVKRWCKNAKSTVTIVEMLPFVPFFAFAVVLEVLLSLVL